MLPLDREVLVPILVLDLVVLALLLVQLAVWTKRK